LPEAERFKIRASRHDCPRRRGAYRGCDGRDLPWDGQSWRATGARPLDHQQLLQRRAQPRPFQDGWFRTGDVVTIDEEGYMQIVDRTKDLVKSGGEWISTVELESAIMGHPQVMEAAVIAVPHSKWQERPLAVVVAKQDADEAQVKQELYDLLAKQFAKWQLPDAIEFVSEIPKTSVGKFDKKVLRVRYQEYRLPEVQ
jgi:fatty-acyl-CoA synthase